MKKMLLIEDNDDNLYLMKFIIEQQGFTVIEARTGSEGLEFALKELPDLILMDIQLPDINGLEVTRALRNDIHTKNIPIVAISSYAMTGDRQKALDAGCSGYIEKPIDPENIMNSIYEFL